jgi:nitrous oxidase accessory protein NosD
MASSTRKRRFVVAAIAAGTGAWIVGAGAAPASANDSHGHTVYVSTHAKSGNSGRSCDSAKYDTIAKGVAAAPTRGTVVVCRGTYAEDVLINKALTLEGRHATIDATGLENAIQVVASHVWVGGFKLENANGEGLLAGVDAMTDAALLPKGSPVLDHITVDHVAAVNNDKGFNGTETGNCKYPGDCGGGVHFNVVAWSKVTDSRVVGNADGILLTDDYGPNSHNRIEGNYVADNKTECGIVLPSHSTTAVTFDPKTFVVSGRNPAMGGVFDNVVRDNVVLRNGTAKAPPQFGGGGSGAGVGIFGSGPGSGAYDNLVVDNYIAGSGMAGFTIHAHHPGGEDVNGNKVIDNTFGTNNLGGDGFDGPPVTNFKTTAIAVFSVPTVSMTITDNTISHNAIGIWLSTTVTAKGLRHNEFHHVTTKVVRG